MPKSHAVEDALAELHQLRDDPTSPAALGHLRTALKGRSAHVAAKAAQIAGEHEIAALSADLIAAFERLLINPVKSDPGCRGKAAVADALYRIGADAEAVFLRGIRYVQMEPVYGGKVDTAIELRGVCALGLVRVHYHDVMTELADLLADREAPARAAAARALAYSEQDAGIPLLHLKVLTGDPEPEVLGECFAALLTIAPATSLEFVARFLDVEDPIVREMAAVALGGSRRREAFDLLRDWWRRTQELDLRRTALLAIAMLRHDVAIDFLISVIADDTGPNARDAIAALGVYRHDPTVSQRTRDTASHRRDLDLAAALAKAFDR